MNIFPRCHKFPLDRSKCYGSLFKFLPFPQFCKHNKRIKRLKQTQYKPMKTIFVRFLCKKYFYKIRYGKSQCVIPHKLIITRYKIVHFIFRINSVHLPYKLRHGFIVIMSEWMSEFARRAAHLDIFMDVFTGKFSLPSPKKA